MSFIRTKRGSIGAIDTRSMVRVWLVKILVELGAHKEFLSDHCFSNDSIANAIGLGGWVDWTSNDLDRKKVMIQLRKIHREVLSHLNDYKVPAILRENVERLAELAGLSATDCRILEFAVLIRNEPALDQTCDLLGMLSSQKVFHALSVILGLHEGDVRASLSSSAILAKSGLVVVDRTGSSHLISKLDLLSHHFADLISSSDVEPEGLLKDTVYRGLPSNLTIADYEHVEDSLHILRPFLKKSMDTGRKGVNIYVHGAPGTGKSELARTLAQELQCDLFEVASQDAEGDPVSGVKRLRAYRAAQCFFALRRSLLVFDEAEDVFNDGDGFMGRKSTAQSNKAWINRMLEENVVPTIWLSNSIRGMDPAFIRRFDVVFELTVPPKKQRERIIRSVCDDLLDEKQVSRIADATNLAPAIVTRASSVARSIQTELGGAVGVASAIHKLISSTLQAQGHGALHTTETNRLPDIYDPNFIHADADLVNVATGLQYSKSGRICLYGPPGTGKTAFGRWLADQLGMPLLVKRASDLMSMWVGENEKNIALAFKQAEDDGALLLIDEVDSFLQDRRDAKASWESRLVNEMLTQMESFSGVFVASTNLMTGLDQASLRRFDLKVKFGFLKPDQACEMLVRQCVHLGLEAPSASTLARTARMNMLTPGDFAAVARQNRFRRIGCASDLVDALGAECAIKEGSQSSMGFLN
ncbi:ATP-binding protein [Curvibacter sp. APW13]|uniref:AAA family ATPase n=1 Tax=Curvibacter sp. APW13 TaxID=3077236 RepID=UPI0028DD91AC|nr:ATP-binding protein [Curvibacter sp. APW13]MDT8990715.1 ATP-binding protein [Curvibacter sp. APW13]